MLVLSHKASGGVRLTGGLTVTVNSVKRGRARIACSGPGVYRRSELQSAPAGGSRTVVLTRSKGEKIVVEGLGSFTVLEFRGNRVKIGYEFPAEVQVSRFDAA